MKRASEPAGEMRSIDVGLINEPTRPIRQSMDQVGLDRLAESIRAVGVIQPIAVRQDGVRYEIIVGHRRYMAARQAGLTTIPARVYPAGCPTAAAMLLHENAEREAVNPADEAVWLDRLRSEVAGGDTDRLAELVRHTRGYVEQRLLLLEGDAVVLDALQRRAISFGVARELNRIDDQAARRMYLDTARKNGATTRVVADWRRQWELMAPGIIAADPAPTAEDARPAPPAPFRPECVICESSEDHWQMDLLQVHRGVCRRLLDNMLARLPTRANDGAA